MVEVLVEEQCPQGRHPERHRAHAPKWHLGLKQHGGDADPFSGQRGAAQLHILRQRSSNVIRNPFSAWRRKLRNHVEGQVRIKRLDAFQEPGDQVV